MDLNDSFCLWLVLYLHLLSVSQKEGNYIKLILVHFLDEKKKRKESFCFCATREYLKGDNAKN